VLLDTLEKRLLLDGEFEKSRSVHQSPEAVAEDGADQPAEQCSAKSDEAHADERVWEEDLGDFVGQVGCRGEDGKATREGGDGGEHRGDE